MQSAQTYNHQSILQRWLYVWIFVIFVCSQLLAYFWGIRFAGSSKIIIEPFWQYLDISILQNDLLRGLYYLHSQPPLFNWLLGITLKIFPQHYELVFSLIIRGFALATLLLMALLMIRLSVRPVLILLICGIFAIFPNFLVYSNLLFYTLPIAFLLLLSGYFLQRFFISGKASYARIFAWCCATIMMTRSIYHIGWFVIAIVGIFLMVEHASRRTLLRACIIPILIVVLWYGKNWLLVGFAGPSSWLGMNLARGWILPSEDLQKFNAFFNQHEIQQIAERKIVNAEWLAGPFMQAKAYAHLGYFSNTHFVHPAISSPEKQSGFPNFNHEDYVKLSKKMLEADLRIIQEYPGKYLSRVLLNFQLFLQPATGPSWFLVQSYDYTGVEKYRRLMGFLLFQGKTIDLSKGVIPLNSLYFYFPALILFGIFKTFSKDNNRAVYLYVTWTILWVALTTNMIEFGENNRIRFEIDPFLVVLFASAIQSVVKFFKTRTTPTETS